MVLGSVREIGMDKDLKQSAGIGLGCVDNPAAD
jgi:hypothetical protein